jgi:hypothetical protein
MNPPSKPPTRARRTCASTLFLAIVLAHHGGRAAEADQSADHAWQQLHTLGRSATKSTPGQPNAAPLSRNEVAATFITQADQLRAFYVRFPTHSSVREAKRLECLALIQAALNGNAAMDARRRALVEEVRKDQAVADHDRYEVVAWDRQIGASRSLPGTFAARMAIQEGISRDLVTEFPKVPMGYESLVAVARDSDPARGKVVLRDLVAMPVPPAIGAEAMLLSARLDLVGKSLPAILEQAGMQASARAMTNRPIIVFAWMPGNRASISTAKRFAKLVPTAALLGVCLAKDTPEARAAAVKDKVPGDLHFDSRGAGSPLALTLVLNRAPLVYLVSRDGRIADVNALVDTGAKLTRHLP